MSGAYKVSTQDKVFQVVGSPAEGWNAPGFSGQIKVQGDSFHGFYVDFKGERVRVSVIEVDFRLRTVVLPDPAGKKISELRSPMPGLVLTIPVKPGDVVRKGEALLILEAMKMENVLKAPSDLLISEIKVVQGQAVEKNQPLILFG
jgi:biotin carboxyl carrier protein